MLSLWCRVVDFSRSSCSPQATPICLTRSDGSSQRSLGAHNDRAAAARPSFARVWHVTHREHNRLMHALHGNGTTLESVHGAVRDELSAYVEHLDASGTLEEWLKYDATVRPQKHLTMIRGTEATAKPEYGTT